MASILESIIGLERFAASMRGEKVQITEEEVSRFRAAMANTAPEPCQTPCLFRSE